MTGRFRFSLQALLELRKRSEDRLKMELSGKTRKLLEESSILKGYFDARKGHSLEFGSMLAKGVELGKIDIYRNFIRGTDEKIKQTEQRISLCEDEIERARKSLAEASKKRKGLEKMKEKRWRDYLMAMERMERKLLDETATRKYVDGLMQRDEIKG